MASEFECLELDQEGTADLDKILRATLAVVQKHSSATIWSIYEIWAVANPESGINVLQLEREVDAEERGLRKSLEEIRQLCSKLLQVIDVIIVGGESDENLPERRMLDGETGAYETKVELVDSTSVVVKTRNRKIAAALLTELSFGRC